jgi:hypothetical protein
MPIAEVLLRGLPVENQAMGRIHAGLQQTARHVELFIWCLRSFPVIILLVNLQKGGIRNYTGGLYLFLLALRLVIFGYFPHLLDPIHFVLHPGIRPSKMILRTKLILTGIAIITLTFLISRYLAPAYMELMIDALARKKYLDDYNSWLPSFRFLFFFAVAIGVFAVFGDNSVFRLFRWQHSRLTAY